MTISPEKPELTHLERAVLNHLQYGIDPIPRPFDALAKKLGTHPQAIVDCLKGLKERGLLMRFGPLYHAEHMGGEVSLVAMAVPQARFEEVTEIVNAYPEVAHNYARDHPLNMWFVVSADQPGRINQVLEEIGQKTGLTPLNMPKEAEYYVGLYFKV